MSPYDAVLVVSFGGPEGPDDVLPFLANVLRGKNVPRERMLEVAEHYYQFGGISPINAQNRALVEALQRELADHGLDLPVYWGNRNWHPFLDEALRQMQSDGVQRALAFFTSAYSSYSGCRQYREDIQRAQETIGEGAPIVHKLRAYFNHPGFIEAMADRVLSALGEIPPDRRGAARLVFTAHSIPLAMAARCDYERQLREASSLVAQAVGHDEWELVYQSRSGPPTQPWLEPDVCDYVTQLGQSGRTRDVVLAPIGFISDHVEVLYDLDTEARGLCEELGLRLFRAKTVETHPRFISMIRELITERIAGSADRPALGKMGPGLDVCLPGCCPSGRPQ